MNLHVGDWIEDRSKEENLSTRQKQAHGRVTHSLNEHNEPIYTCQGTEVLDFTQPLYWWDFRQYPEDYISGNASLSRPFKGFVYGLFWPTSTVGLKIGTPLRWIYYEFAWGPYPRKPGTIFVGRPSPTGELNLQPGERVHVKSYLEILYTDKAKAH
jgi:hypothetical protein